MVAKKKAKPTGKALRVEGDLTIFRAAELKPLLLDSVEVMEIDLSGVGEIDTAGLQLLMLAKKQSLVEQRTLRLVGHSPAVTDLFERLNVAAYFGDPLVVAPAEAPSPKRRSKTAAPRN